METNELAKVFELYSQWQAELHRVTGAALDAFNPGSRTAKGVYDLMLEQCSKRIVLRPYVFTI